VTIPRDPIGYSVRAIGAIARDPAEGIERVRERLAERWDLRTSLPRYSASPDWESSLHQRLGCPWPCPFTDVFLDLWSNLTRSMRSRGLDLGQGAYGGWDDGDSSFARAAWCLTVHLRPRTVIETGVARGLTTRCVLEAIERNGHGHLWSIDLAPLIETSLAFETAAAVDESSRSAWTFVVGSSRRRLPSLVRKVGEVDIFVHDSMHTTRNVDFELDRVWPSVPSGGYVVVDDIDLNRSFDRLLKNRATQFDAVVAHSDRGGVFAIAQKA